MPRKTSQVEVYLLRRQNSILSREPDDRLLFSDEKFRNQEADGPTRSITSPGEILGRSNQTGVLRKCCFYMSALEFTNNYAHGPAQRPSISKVATLLSKMFGNITVSTNAILRRATTVRRISHGKCPRGRSASRFLGRPKFVSCMVIIEEEQFECSWVPSEPHLSCPQVLCWFYFPCRIALLAPSSTAPLIS